MVVLLPPRGPITPHLLLDSTNQMLTTPSRSSIFYFGLGNLLSYLCHRSTLLYYSTIIYFVVFFETLFTYTSYMCCIFSIFQYIHHPSASLTPSPNPSSCPSVVLMSCSFCSLGVKILASWPLIFLPVPQSPNHTSQQERWYHPVKNSSKSPLTLFSTHSTLPALSSSSLLWTVPWFAWLTPAI